MRWCNGPCGRQLPVEAFRSNGQGLRASFCNACHRVDARGRYRRRYRWDDQFRQRERERARTYYARLVARGQAEEGK
jgi:hypothetical protein